MAVPVLITAGITPSDIRPAQIYGQKYSQIINQSIPYYARSCSYIVNHGGLSNVNQSIIVSSRRSLPTLEYSTGVFHRTRNPSDAHYKRLPKIFKTNSLFLRQNVCPPWLSFFFVFYFPSFLFFTFAVSMIATFPPGPARGIASLSVLAQKYNDCNLPSRSCQRFSQSVLVSLKFNLWPRVLRNVSLLYNICWLANYIFFC